MSKILYSIGPIVIACKLFAFVPLNLTRRYSTPVKILNIIYVLCLSLFWSNTSYQRIFYPRGQVVKGSHISKMAYHMDIILSFMMMLCLNIGNFLMKQKVLDLVEKLEAFDSKLSRFAVKINYKRHRNISGLVLASVLGFLFISFTLAAFVATISTIKTSEKQPNIIGPIIMFITMVIFCGVFCVFMAGIKLRLKLINEFINTSLNNDKVLSGSLLYICIYEITLIINKLFSLPVAIYISANLLSSAFLFYDLFALYIQPNPTQLIYCIIATILSFHFFVYTFLLIYFCSSTAKEGRKCMEILEKNVNCDDLKVKKRIMFFIQQFNHFEVKISCGLFELDWRVLYMVKLDEF